MEAAMHANDWQNQARAMVRRAIQAPSSHNTQPWLFGFSAAVIELYAGRTRALPVNDPDDRELTISCGCALMNLRVAAASAGFRVRLQCFPEAEEPDLQARLRLDEAANADAGLAQLAEFIDHRHTCRKLFSSRKVDPSVRAKLLKSGEREGALWEPLLEKDARQMAVNLVAQGDKIQWDNPSWRRELAAWLHPRRQGDGLAMPSPIAPLARTAVRNFDMGDWVAGRDQKLAEAAPLLVVLATDGDEPRDWLLAGQALQRLLLVARRHGLQASYFNQPHQVATLRPELQALVNQGAPQILLGLGYPDQEITPTPRRPIEEVLV